ncbi:MAG: hypothetical protein VX398_02025 [Acidobacteriota bacterium]|nr:hypothetical protein [Acidobacteriota bacterium]
MLPALAVLLVHAAIGMLVCAAIARSPAGPGFYRMILLIVLACLILGFGLRLGPASETLPMPTNLSVASYVVAVVATIVFGISLQPGTTQSFIKLTGAAICGTLAILTDTAIIQGATSVTWTGQVLYHAGIIGVLPAVGSVLFAMLLAHWYLVEPRMPLEPLRRILIVFVATQFFLLISVAGVIAYHWPEWTGMDGGLVRAFTLGNALFVFMRTFLGVLAPIGLAWMTWKTVELRSIQSATGILYAAVVFVLFGETISIYLSLATGQPY